MNKKEIALILGLVFTIGVSIVSQCVVQASSVQQNTLRLHVIANSDSDEDVNIKLYVKDEILKMEDILPYNAYSFEIAKEETEDILPVLEERINDILTSKGVSYKAKCSVENFYFDTIQYSGFALPKGEYTALTVRLGKAEGKNWWCVMYPALCSQAFGEKSLENSDEFIKTDKITPRFKVVEIYENIKHYFSQKTAPDYTNG